MTGGLQGCEHLENGVKSMVELACKTQLDGVLNSIEEKYETVLAEQCEKIKQTLIDNGVDTTDVKEKECLDDGAAKLDEETQAERDNMTALCVAEMSNYTDFSSMQDKVQKFIDNNKVEIDLQGKLDQALEDLKDEAQKGIDGAKDSINDGLDHVSDKIGDDDDDDETSAAHGSNTTRLYAALRISAMGSGSAATMSLFGAALVALAGLLALVRRGASRQGDAEQHEMLAAGEDSEIGQ